MTFKDSLDIGYKNPRNAVAGILNRDDGKYLEYLKVKFYHVYDRDDFTFSSSHFEFIDTIGLPCVNYIVLLNNNNVTDEVLSELYKDMKGECDYPIDGLVVTTSSNHEENVYYPEYTTPPWDLIPRSLYQSRQPQEEYRW